MRREFSSEGTKVVEITDFYWNSLEHYVIEWYPAVEEEMNRQNNIPRRKIIQTRCKELKNNLDDHDQADMFE